MLLRTYKLYTIQVQRNKFFMRGREEGLIENSDKRAAVRDSGKRAKAPSVESG